MTINLKNLTVKNFISIGNQTQAINFTNSNLTLVLGENLDQGGDGSGNRNGTGKSSIVNALSYALYGQALTSIKKDNLINKINNKNMLVTINFEKNGINYRIERGRRPHILKIFIDDVEQAIKDQDDAQGDSRETQKELTNLIGMSHDMFKHILALNTFTEPFLSMRAADQRMIIEQLLGITVLSEKADILKEYIRVSKEEIFKETTNIEATTKSNEKIQQSIDTLTLRQTAWKNQYEKDIIKIRNAISNLKNVDIESELSQHQLLTQYLDNFNIVKTLTNEKNILDKALIQAEKNVGKYTTDLNMIQLKTCHACGQELQDEKYSEMILITQQHLDDAVLYLHETKTKLNNINNKIAAINVGIKPITFYKTITEALKHQNNLESLISQLSLKLKETDPYKEQIDELKHTALQVINWDIVNDLTKSKEHQEFLLKLLTNKDSFIRKKIIDQNLSYLNTRLAYYLDKTGLPHYVIFKNDLSVEITQLGQDLDFDNLSRGERNRLIISLSLAFRDVWENLYCPINLLFIDELIDNGLDANGIESALAILKKIVRDRDKNIFLISHKDELIGRVNNVLKVTKENNFTSFATDIEIF